MNMNKTEPSAKQLRKHFRQQRRNLSLSQQFEHAIHLASQLSQHSQYKRSKKIAAYLPADGEISPEFLIHHAWTSNKQVYLPVLAPFSQRLYFAPYTPGCAMKANRFGILEPDVVPRQWLRAHQLGLILMPLVGFDMLGNRLGMGGGFYDRSLAFTRHRQSPHRPHLIGLAHHCQQAEHLPVQAHDVPLQMLATELGVFNFPVTGQQAKPTRYLGR